MDKRCDSQFHPSPKLATKAHAKRVRLPAIVKDPFRKFIITAERAGIGPEWSQRDGRTNRLSNYRARVPSGGMVRPCLRYLERRANGGRGG
jgi:hypothetical protein